MEQAENYVKQSLAILETHRGPWHSEVCILGSLIFLVQRSPKLSSRHIERGFAGFSLRQLIVSQVAIAKQNLGRFHAARSEFDVAKSLFEYAVCTLNITH